MKNAPSVSYPVGRLFWLGRVWGLVGLLLAGLHAWAWHTQALSLGRLGVSAAMAAALWSWAGWVWRRFPLGWLTWLAVADQDGPPGGGRSSGGWWWSGVEGAQGYPVVRVECMWVSERWAALRLHAASGVPVWVGVEAGAAPDRWLALRRALVRNGN